MLTPTLTKILSKFNQYTFDDTYNSLTGYDKTERQHKLARRMYKFASILKLASMNDCTYDEAEILWHTNNSKAGIACEEALIRLFNQGWGIKSKRVSRSGRTPRKTKRPKKSKVKTYDITIILENNYEIAVESKLRSDPKSLYDDIQKSPKCYKVSYANNDYYVLPQEQFRALLVDREAPIIKHSNRGIKFYHDLFTTTDDKTEFIDIVSLKQKTFDYMFIIRPLTMQKLLDRCIRF